DGPTTVRLEGHLVVFSLRYLPEELKSLGTLLALDAVWRCPRATRRQTASKARSVPSPPSGSRRGLVAARNGPGGRCQVPPAPRQVRSEALVRTDHHHPGRG